MPLSPLICKSRKRPELLFLDCWLEKFDYLWLSENVCSSTIHCQNRLTYWMNLSEGPAITSPVSALPVFKQAGWEGCVCNCLLYSAHLLLHTHPVTAPDEQGVAEADRSAVTQQVVTVTGTWQVESR